MASEHTLDWFTSRVGGLVNRNGKAFKIPNKASATYCKDLQKEGFFFSDRTAKPRITVSQQNICTMCEG